MAFSVPMPTRGSRRGSKCVRATGALLVTLAAGAMAVGCSGKAPNAEPRAGCRDTPGISLHPAVCLPDDARAAFAVSEAQVVGIRTSVERELF